MAPHRSSVRRSRTRRVTITNLKKKKNTGGGRVFSLDAALCLLATRRRLGRRGDSFALRSAVAV